MNFAVEKLTRYRNRAMASFFIDDFCGATPEDGAAYKRFSEWMESTGVKGEISAVLAMKRSPEGRALPVDPTFAAELSRGSRPGGHLEAFMEVMTHWSVYDFALDRIRPDAPHEGVWLNQRNRPADEYRDYFANIARRAQAAGFRHAGLTQPGCSCQQCLAHFYGSHLTWEGHELNPMVARAMIDLAKTGDLAGPALGMFIGWRTQGPTDVSLILEDDRYGVYEIQPGIKEDYFARAKDDPRPLDVSPLIAADGQGGRLPEMLAQGTQTLVYFSHWQNVRPEVELGFQAFQEVARRLNEHWGDRIVWMRPSEIAAYRHTERHTQVWPEPDGFRITIPFEPLHPLSFRVAGARVRALRSPSGVEIVPGVVTTGSCTLYEFLPENGKYEEAR
jgi:hypothetical protein